VNQCRMFSSLNRVQHLQRAKRESTTPVIAVERELVDTTGCQTVLDESNVWKREIVSSVRISITPPPLKR
jgi:hypothetical protein